jgi:hypothetical protein
MECVARVAGSNCSAVRKLPRQSQVVIAIFAGPEFVTKTIVANLNSL